MNPSVTSVLGVPSHPSVAALPKTPDLAIVAVPAAAVPAVAEECGRAGVRALVVVTAGLDHTQAHALLTACRTYGMRLVGPNCLGVSNTDPELNLDATFAAEHPRPGTAGVAVQSGGVGIALLDGLSRLGIGVSSFASLGDKYDVSGNDMLQWWESDGRTDLALLHLESFGNPRAFSRTARRVTRRMPGADRGCRAHRRGPQGRRLAHRGGRHPHRDPAGAVHPGRCHRDPVGRRTPGNRGPVALAAAPGRQPRRDRHERGRSRGAHRRRLCGGGTGSAPVHAHDDR